MCCSSSHFQENQCGDKHGSDEATYIRCYMFSFKYGHIHPKVENFFQRWWILGVFYDNFIHGETTKHSSFIFKFNNPTFLPNNIGLVLWTPTPRELKRRKNVVPMSGEIFGHKWSKSSSLKVQPCTLLLTFQIKMG